MKPQLQKSEHHLFLSWLIFTGVVLFLLVVAWQENILATLLAADRSKISVAISLSYAWVTLHCALRVFKISSEINKSKLVETLITEKGAESKLIIKENKIAVNDNLLPDCLVTDYICELFSKNKLEERDQKINNLESGHIEFYISKLKSPHEIGWFIADLMIRMGLLGTIIGFILMLGAVANMSDFNANAVQKVLSHMSAGMGTALYTTLAGLICSILSAIQYQMLDRGADDLIASMRHLVFVHLPEKSD